MPWQLHTRAPVAQQCLVTRQQLIPVGACRASSGFQAPEVAAGGKGELESCLCLEAQLGWERAG